MALADLTTRRHVTAEQVEMHKRYSSAFKARFGPKAEALFSRAAAVWCRLMHENLSWPIKGRYVCRTCGIVYIVPWRQDLMAAATHVNEVQEHSVLAAADLAGAG